MQILERQIRSRKLRIISLLLLFLCGNDAVIAEDSVDKKPAEKNDNSRGEMERKPVVPVEVLDRAKQIEQKLDAMTSNAAPDNIISKKPVLPRPIDSGPSVILAK